MKSLFDDSSQRRKNLNTLASKMRPESMNEVIGQSEALGEGSVLNAIYEGKLNQSLLLIGPPGCGKTTIARIIANSMDADLIMENGTTCNVSVMRSVFKQALETVRDYERRTILLIDEIHHMNRAQQDFLLKAVEDSEILLIGITTENPSFFMSRPLLSRLRVVSFKPLEDEDISAILRRALCDSPKGLGMLNLKADEDAVSYLISKSAGDARVALNFLESCANEVGKGGRVDLNIAERATVDAERRSVRDGDTHYNMISAFIKSMRGSDSDAAVYWLMRMLSLGEDPRFIARRMLIFASEDIGLADNRALLLAEAAVRAAEIVGMPECAINLTHTAVYLSLSPKSNSVIKAMARAESLMEKYPGADVPSHIADRKSVTGSRSKSKYKYPHDYPQGYVEQDYLPSQFKGEKIFQHNEHGEEDDIVRRHLERKRKSYEEGTESS